MSEPTEAEKLYAAAKAALAICPDCGHPRTDCTCYEYSGQWLEDLRAGWDHRIDNCTAAEASSESETS